MGKKQAGFTLVELVFVIVILGILAAFAIPRYVDLTQEARAAAMNGLAGGVRSASALVHAVSVAQQEERQATSDVTAEGVTVNTQYGYPTTAGIQAAVDNDLLDGNAYISSTAANAITWSYTQDGGTTAIANCNVSYTAPTTVDSSPTITVDVAGC